MGGSRIAVRSVAAAIAVLSLVAVQPVTPAGADDEGPSAVADHAGDEPAAVGTIRGTVTADHGGDPLERVCVTARNDAGEVRDVAYTDESGRYVLGGLPSGEYLVGFNTCGSTDHRAEYHADAFAAADADLVEVRPGTIQDIDASLAGPSSAAAPSADPVEPTDGPAASAVAPSAAPDPAEVQATGHITGTVTEDGTGTPLEGICVTAHQSDSIAGSGDTLSDGTYDLGGLATGSYMVEFSDCTGLGTHVDEWYDDTYAHGSASEVEVTDGSTSAGVDAALAPAAHITGTVTSEISGNPVSDLCVRAVRTTDDWTASTNTDGTGAYDLTVLEGSYTVEFRDCSGFADFAREWFDGARKSEATPVTATAGAPATGIDASLGLAGHIEGTVTTEEFGTAISDICVTPYDSTGTAPFAVHTDENGEYELHGLREDTYTVEFSDCLGNGFVSEYFDDTTAGDATPLEVTPGSVTIADAGLAQGGAISGVVTADDTGLPVEGVCVSAYDGGGFFASTETAGDGSYLIGAIPTGDYVVEFCDTHDLVGEFHDDAVEQSAATLVSVTGGSESTGVNAALTTAAHITGTVVSDETGAALEGICVSAYGDELDDGHAETAADGSFDIGGLRADTYYIYFEDCASGAHVSEYFDDAGFDTATPVVVATGQTATGTDASLALGGNIAGTVTSDQSGLALQNMCVNAYEEGTFAGSAVTDADGAYDIGDLAPGSYTVAFRDCTGTGEHLTEYFDDVLDHGAATPVPVTGGSTTDVDAALAIAGRITGTVTSDVTGVELENVCVQAYDADGDAAGARKRSAADGTYEIGALGTGSYALLFTDCSIEQAHGSEYYEDQTNRPAATMVAVTDGETVSGIDASLGAAATISGQVTDDGQPAQACIEVYRAVGHEHVSGHATDESGNYEVPGLGAGGFKLEFDLDCADTELRWWQNASDSDGADVITLTAGENRTDVDIDLGGLSATSPDPVHDVNTPGRSVDGDLDTYWQPTGTPGTKTIEIALPDPTELSSIRTRFYSTDYRFVDYTIETWDGTTWTTAASVTDNAHADTTSAIARTTDRFRITATNWTSPSTTYGPAIREITWTTGTTSSHER